MIDAEICILGENLSALIVKSVFWVKVSSFPLVLLSAERGFRVMMWA